LGCFFTIIISDRKVIGPFIWGQSLPLDDLRRIVRQLKPRYIFTSLVAKMDEDEFENFFTTVGSFFDLKNLFVGGYQLGIHGDLKPKR
jgi:hypothetical protein